MRTGVPSQPQQHDEREACTHSHTYAISRRLQVFKNHTIMTLTHSSVRETTQGEVATLSMSELITVHVVDRNRNINKDFLCSRRQVLRHMKYFETHLTVGIAADGTLPDVDISVHCDARVFEWLVNYISETEPRPRISEHDLSHDGCLNFLSTSPLCLANYISLAAGGSVVSLLVSSEFLQMESLMNECLVYFRDHFRTVMKVPLDISCLSDTLISKLSAITTDQQLITLKVALCLPAPCNSFEHTPSLLTQDPKDKLLGRLYRLRLQTMVQSSSVRLLCCRACRSLYSNAFRCVRH